MPLLFSILECYNLLSKQPNYTCGLFSFFDLMFMLVSWARAIMSISKKTWIFPGRPYYYIFPRINREPYNSKTEWRKGHTEPPGQPRGEELSCSFFSHPVTLSRPGHVLAAPDMPDCISVLFSIKSFVNTCWQCHLLELLHCYWKTKTKKEFRSQFFHFLY